MRILISGGTGFLGQRVVSRLVAEGHKVTLVSRSIKAIRPAVAGCDCVTWEMLATCESAKSVELVVHLAGEPVFPGRWTQQKRQDLHDSRVKTLLHIFEALKEAGAPLKRVVSASAVGFYGNSGIRLVDESASNGTDFLAKLVADWEHCAQVDIKNFFPDATAVSLRFGVILDKSGGVLGRLLPLFRFGLGGKLGSGAQWMSWVHVRDALESVLFAVDNPLLNGSFNVAAPHAVTNAEFTKALGKALSRPTLLAVPAKVLNVVFGDGSTVVLEGQRVSSEKLAKTGFRFRFETLKSALDDILG